MKGLSKKEIEVISSLEFEKKYFFARKDISKFFKNNQQINDFIFGLKTKNRIIKINKAKYYLVPIKAKTGRWLEHPFIIVDEICDSKDYFVGGWSAANYWGLTDQVPMQVDVFTTRRQGKINVLNTRIVFHRTSKKNVKNCIKENIESHSFFIQLKEDSKEWLKSRK